MIKKIIMTVLFIVVFILLSIYLSLFIFKIDANIDYYISKQNTTFSKDIDERMFKKINNLNYLDAMCTYRYMHAIDEKKLNYCQKYNLEENISGGCNHIIGTYMPIDTFNALNYCNIKY